MTTNRVFMAAVLVGTIVGAAFAQSSDAIR
jgi:hypothetical protein